MPAAMVLQLVPADAVSLDRRHGKALHGLVFALLDQIDPKLTRRLHESGDLKPFSISPLAGLRSWEPLDQLRAGQACRLRLAVVQEELAQRLNLQFLEGSAKLRILDQSWSLERLWVTPQSPEPWASLETLDALLQRVKPTRDIELEFVTPTAFRQSDVNLPLPLPNLVFGSLLKRASVFFPACFLPADAQALTETLNGQVMVARHQIQTEVAMEVGFTGKVRFEASRSVPEPLLLLLNFLAELSFYLGVGLKTTMGMGMCRRIPGPDRRSTGTHAAS